MNPNFVRKRKDDTIRGPYEPSAPKIYRPSGKKIGLGLIGHDSMPWPISHRSVPDHEINICFSYCRKFIASSCWSFAKFESSMASCNFLTNYLARYQKYQRYDRISFMYPGLFDPMTHTYESYSWFKNYFRVKLLCHFACKCQHIGVCRSRSATNFYQNQ